MAEVTMRTLNQETSKVIARVKSGEEVVLTERGEVVARIVPATKGVLDELVSEGKVIPAATHGRAPRASISASEDVTAGELLERMRSDERY